MNNYTIIISTCTVVALVLLRSSTVTKNKNTKQSPTNKKNTNVTTPSPSPSPSPPQLHDIENVTNTSICPEPDCETGKGNPKYLYHPKNLNEVQAIIRAQHFGKTVKVSGSHKHKDISYTKDVIIRTLLLNKILDLHKQNNTITVESGLLLSDLYEYLDTHGLALSVVSQNGWKSVGSAVCTSDHGSNILQGTICSLVQNIKVVLANGTISSYSKHDKEFHAIVGGTGGIAFIYSITLLCSPAYNIHQSITHTSWQDISTKLTLNTCLDKHPCSELNINPHTNNCTVTSREPVVNTLLQNISSTLSPNTSPSYKVLSGKVYRDQTREFGVEYDSLVPAVNDVLDIITNSNDRDVSICLRFSGKDEHSLLSTASNRQHTCWIDINGGCDKLLQSIETRLISTYKGRPSIHGKNTINEQTMMKLYDNEFHEYKHIRNLLDPERIFTNDYIRVRFGM